MPDLLSDPPVRCFSAQPVNHHCVAHLLVAPQQFPHPALCHLHVLGRLPLGDRPLLRLLQPVQPIPFLLAHRHSFHPPALRQSRGTFYFAQLGTSHIAPTTFSKGL